MKLLATDYDGTLRYAQDVMPEDLKSIEEWKNKGNKFVIVTGRSKEWWYGFWRKWRCLVVELFEF